MSDMDKVLMVCVDCDSSDYMRLAKAPGFLFAQCTLCMNMSELDLKTLEWSLVHEGGFYVESA